MEGHSFMSKASPNKQTNQRQAQADEPGIKAEPQPAQQYQDYAGAVLFIRTI